MATPVSSQFARIAAEYAWNRLAPEARDFPSERLARRLEGVLEPALLAELLDRGERLADASGPSSADRVVEALSAEQRRERGIYPTPEPVADGMAAAAGLAAGDCVVDLAAGQASDRALDPDAGATFERLSTATAGEIEAAAGEVTYLRAKNGANDIADNTAASEFFMSQLAYRRRCHSRRLRDSGASPRERGRALARWGMNAFLFVTTGYGERASYTLAASAALIAAYAGLYLAIAPDLFGSVGQYAQLSLGSFIAFFLGGVGEVSDPTVSLLAQSEAFLGGFFVALYVFALTRSVSR